MDALPVADDSDSDESHHTISPSSSTASLPDMAFDSAQVPATIGIPPSSVPCASASASASASTSAAAATGAYNHALASPSTSSSQSSRLRTARPVGLGLSAVNLEGASRRWPVALDLADEALSSEEDDDEDVDLEQHEMDSYMASHRAPVDAALRSMPGVVGLGDGWANVPQSKPKKRWFRKEKHAPASPDDDPLALWATPNAPQQPATSPEKDAGNAKWWRSRKNLFNASQRAVSLPPSTASPSLAAIPPSPSDAHFGAGATKTPPAAIKTRGGRLLGRSRLNFGSMVDLARAKDKDARVPETPQSADVPTFQDAAAKACRSAKRHSVPGVLSQSRSNSSSPRTAHPLELSHGSRYNPAARSQPVITSASSSQPSFSPPVPSHPMLRQAFARSESHLAGSSGVPPRPAPLIINSGAFAPTTSMPLWRPPMMSPTPLLGVQEEDEEEHEQPVPESTERPPLKRSATFGDDDDVAADKKDKPQASVVPLLPTVTASPREPSCAISIHSSNYGGAGNSGNTSGRLEAAPPSTPAAAVKVGIIGRMKNAFSKGKSRRSRLQHPTSPQSFQSENPTPAPVIPEGPTSASTGRGRRRRSSLFTRRNQPAASSTTDFSLSRADDEVKETKRDSVRLSRHVAESMVNLSTPSRNSELAPATPTTPTPGRFEDSSSTASRSSRLKRNSWVGSFPRRRGDDDDMETRDSSFESRRSRVSLRRLTAQNKSRPGLGTVFPRPPTEVQQPPPLHWAIPSSSYSTPMLHKFGGSTLSLALDISAEGIDSAPDDADIGPNRGDAASPTPSESRERHLASTIAALTSTKPRVTSTLAAKETTPRLLQRRVSKRAAEGRTSAPVTVPMNINYAASSDSLSLQPNIVDFPLPPSNSSGDIASSPDPDQVEQLYTPHDPSHYPTVPNEYYSSADVAECGGSSDSSSGSEPARRDLRKQPSWSTCKTSAGGCNSLTPIATPTSFDSRDDLSAPSGIGKHTYNDSFDDQSFHSFAPDERMSAFSTPRSTSVVV